SRDLYAFARRNLFTGGTLVDAVLQAHHPSRLVVELLLAKRGGAQRLQDGAVSPGRKPFYFSERVIEAPSLGCGGIFAYEDGLPPTQPHRPAKANVADERDSATIHGRSFSLLLIPLHRLPSPS